MFKEQLQKDLDAVFFNQHEFADQHILGGRTITCVVDNDRLFNVKNEGTITAEILLYVPKAQISTLLLPNTSITFDGEQMMINDTFEDCGMYQITLERLSGEFEHDIIIQQLESRIDASGFKTNTWTTFSVTKAYMRNLSGNETNSSNAEIGKATTLFKIAYVEGVTRKMRISYNGQFYNIRFVDDVEGKHEYLDIRCEVIC